MFLIKVGGNFSHKEWQIALLTSMSLDISTENRLEILPSSAIIKDLLNAKYRDVCFLTRGVVWILNGEQEKIAYFEE